jgi:hypothetical protein
MLRILTYVFFIFIIVNKVKAENTSKEFWPEVDLWWRTSPDWRLATFFALTKNVETNYREGDILIQGEYSWGESNKTVFMRLVDVAEAEKVKPMMARLGYLKGRGLEEEESGETFSENSAYGEFYFRVPLKEVAFFTQRLRSDLRWLGPEDEYSYRLRYRLMIEREIISNEISYVPYFNLEPYYDSQYVAIKMLRNSIG